MSIRIARLARLLLLSTLLFAYNHFVQYFVNRPWLLYYPVLSLAFRETWPILHLTTEHRMPYLAPEPIWIWMEFGRHAASRLCHLQRQERETSFGPMYVQYCALSRIRETDWGRQGLRGIASVLVVTAHITRSLVPHLLAPAMSEKLPPTFFQLPFVRCLVMGRASVAAFALLAGYVNSLSALKKARAGNTDAALQGIAKSAFRRTGRFVTPAVIATTLSWLLCQFGAYRIANISSSNWIRDTSPGPSSSFAMAFYDLFKNLGTTWLNGANEYDRIQWTLTFLLKGSMMTYLTLFATVYVKPKWRMIICAGLYYFKWKSGDCKF